MTKPRPSEWQRQVLADLDAIVEAFPADVEVLGGYRLDKSGMLRLRLRLRTADLPHVDGGIPLARTRKSS
jgi:hypothetical protein